MDLLLYALILGAAGWVLITYYRSYKHAPAGRRGLLPAHVSLISFSYILAVSAVAFQNYERLGHGYTHYIPMNFLIFVSGVIALAYVLGYEKKVVSIKRKVRVEQDFIIDTGMDEKK